MRIAAPCLLFPTVLATLICTGPAHADVFGFETPSGNIDCTVGLEANMSDIHCIIAERNGPPARPAPVDCNGHWGHDFLMRDRGPVLMLCEDVLRNETWADKAQYGVRGRFGGITCQSSEKGFECRNRDGHGFFLSRARQQVF
jgi:hypothetical protein